MERHHLQLLMNRMNEPRRFIQVMMGPRQTGKTTLVNQLKQKGTLNYYALKNGKEIDFIYNSTVAFEVKETATNADYKQVEKLASNININLTFVISRYPASNFSQSIWGGTIK